MSEDKSSRIMKPSQIPIYGFPESSNAESVKAVAEEPGLLKSGISSARVAIQDVLAPLKGLEDEVWHIYNTGVAHTQSSIDQLRVEENLPMRVGFIAAGGMLGYLVGALRGRFFKKLIYSSVGLGASSALCYPNEANELTSELMSEAKKLKAVAVNFVNGVQPEDVAKSNGDKVKVAKKDEVRSFQLGDEKKVDIPKDLGQSNPDDKDLYSTRSS